MLRVTADQLSTIAGMSDAVIEQIQDNIQETWDAVGKAQKTADDALEAASGEVTGPAGGGGYGPEVLACADAPEAVKRAVKAAGGQVSTGGDDAPAFQNLVNLYGNPRWIGTMKLGSTIGVPKWRYIQSYGPSNYVTGLSTLSGQFFLAQHDHTWFSDFTISAGDEAAGTHHINTNVADQSGFSTGADACTIMERIVSRNAKGDAFIVQGYNNRDSKISKLHAWNAVGRGFNLNSPDGRASDIVSGTSGSHGVELGSSSANWHVDGKMWYSDGDGARVDGARHTIKIEGQDNDLAGVRIIGNLIEIHSWLADSNSYSGTKYTNVHSGMEIGLLPASMTNGVWSAGTTKGGYNITVSGGRAWDKNEGGRGYNQRNGVLIRSGVRGLIMTGVQTGAPADTHRNATGGIVFLTASDLNHSSNFVTACLSNGARMFSA